MGWCETNFRGEDPMLRGIANNSYFYYLHSYALPVSDHTLATANHTGEFSAIVGYRNFFAAQFHPERSSAAGARLLQNFLAAPV
jgi:glutamine amidotransferase